MTLTVQRIRRLLLTSIAALTLAAGFLVGFAPPSTADVPWTGPPCNGCVPNMLDCSPSNSGWCARTNGYTPGFPNSCRWNSKTHYTSATGIYFNNTCNSGYWRPAV